MTETIVQTKFRQNLSLTSLIQLEKYKQSGKEKLNQILHYITDASKTYDCVSKV